MLQLLGWVADSTDCDDTEATTYPGADEYCDTEDNDCDGTIDEDDAVDALTWYIGDETLMGGLPSLKVMYTTSGYADNDTDDDKNGAVNPGATEICDAADTDEDCDSVADDADASTDPSTKFSWYPDTDGDTYGDQSVAEKLACDDPSTASITFVGSNTDCDDTDSTVNPAATEICDSITMIDGTVDKPDALGHLHGIWTRTTMISVWLSRWWLVTSPTAMPNSMVIVMTQTIWCIHWLRSYATTSIMIVMQSSMKMLSSYRGILTPTGMGLVLPMVHSKIVHP